MSDTLLLVLLVLAAYRVTRLVVADTILDGPRAKLYARFPPADYWDQKTHSMKPAHKLGQLIDCPWCTGFWVSIVVVAITWALRPLELPALWFGAVATGVGLIGKADS